MMSAFGITDYLAYVLGTIAIVLLPGPNSMYCMYVASSQGVKQGYKTVLGIFLGDAILMLAAILGAATLLKTSAAIFFVFKLIGGLYLAYLGLNLLIASFKGWKKPTDSIKDTTQIEITSSSSVVTNQKGNVFVKALTLSLSNPKAILFFLSFFVQFVSPNYHNPALSFAILGVTLQVISMSYLSLLIFAGTRLTQFFKKQYKFAAFSNASIGVLFMSFAINLWRAKA